MNGSRWPSPPPNRTSPTWTPPDLILEVAFALNARHGLRLVQRFGVDVSVELHTNLATT